MKFNKLLIRKEILSEYRNNSSLFLITPTMCVLIIVFPLLAENRFAIDEDLFIITQILFHLQHCHMSSMKQIKGTTIKSNLHYKRSTT